MSLKFMKSGGKQYLIVNCFKFRENRTLANGNISWRCCVKDCNSWVKTDSGKTCIVSSKHEHRHKKQCLSPSINCSSSSVHPGSTSTPRQALTTGTPLPLDITVVGNDTANVSTSSSASSLAGMVNLSSMAKLENENVLLKAEIRRLKTENKVILDHSIESDQRLLQYTNDVFSLETTSTSSCLASKTHASIQTDKVDIADNDAATTKHLQDQVRLKEELQAAILKIKSLEETINLINVPCEKCAILKDETRNMIESIKILESENKTLKQNIDGLMYQVNSIDNSSAIPLRNRFLPLSHSEEDFQTVTYKKSYIKKSNNSKKETGIKDNKTKHYSDSLSRNVNKNRHTMFRSVSIIGDSHVRHLAEKVRTAVSPSITVTGVCKPNAGLLHIVPISEPPPDHCYVLLGGSNDVGAGRQDIVYDHFEDILKLLGGKSRVLVCPLLPRYDLPFNSLVHGNIARVNAYINDLCSRDERAEMMDIGSIGRRHFTTHGLHLRNSGKRLLADIIVDRLSSLTPAPRYAEKIPSDGGLSPATQEPVTLPYESYAEAAAQPSLQKTCLDGAPVKRVTVECAGHERSFLE